ncbi:MAG: hypothetical protein AAF734_07995, partial [Bacteroidota bacterium]
IFSSILAVVAVGLVWYLTRAIAKPIEEKARIQEVERQIIDRLKLIREAQVMHLDVKGVYANDFDELVNFIKQGKIYTINRKEIPVTGDSSFFQIDTLGTIPVRDSLLQGEYIDYNLKELPYIPGKEEQVPFEIFVSIREALSGDTVYAIEVSDRPPLVNPRREEPLKFGSRENISTRGNWEF